MRNNEDRVGTKKTKPKSTAATQAALAPLDFVRPTTIVALPSEGKFYGEGHPLHGEDSIEIRQMTTAEEDILTNRSLLKQGKAIDKFLERLMVDSGVKPAELLVSDKNAVLIQARIDGYGADYTTSVQCPACSHSQKEQFDLDESVITTGGECVIAEPTAHGTFTTTLDNDWVVEFKPLTGADEAKLMKSMENAKRANRPERTIQDQLNAMIVSVSGHTDDGTISKAVEHMTGKQSRHLRAAYKDAVPNIEIRSTVTCRECATTSELEVPLTADFFWFKS